MWNTSRRRRGADCYPASQLWDSALTIQHANVFNWPQRRGKKKKKGFVCSAGLRNRSCLLTFSKVGLSCNMYYFLRFISAQRMAPTCWLKETSMGKTTTEIPGCPVLLKSFQLFQPGKIIRGSWIEKDLGIRTKALKVSKHGKEILANTS